MSQKQSKDEDVYLTYEYIHLLVKELADRIKNDGFIPDYIIAIGTGGYIPARMFKSHLNRKILGVVLSYYDDNDRLMTSFQKIQWIDHPELVITGKLILIIDEVNDTGSTMAYVVQELLNSHPTELAIMVLHDKQKPKKGTIPPQIKRYYVGEYVRDKWIHYPWETNDILHHNYLAAKYTYEQRHNSSHH